MKARMIIVQFIQHPRTRTPLLITVISIWLFLALKRLRLHHQTPLQFFSMPVSLV